MTNTLWKLQHMTNMQYHSGAVSFCSTEITTQQKNCEINQLNIATNYHMLYSKSYLHVITVIHRKQNFSSS